MRGTVGDIVAVPGGRDLGPAILAEARAVSAAADLRGVFHGCFQDAVKQFGRG
jgi:hypothetical protein